MSLVAPSKPASCHISPAECQVVPGNAGGTLVSQFTGDSRGAARGGHGGGLDGGGGSDTEGRRERSARPSRGKCMMAGLIEVAVGETVILLHPPLPSVGVSIEVERGCPQNDRRLT